MTTMRLSSLILAVGLMAGAAGPVLAQDGEARQTIQVFSDTLLDVMRQAEQLGFKGREQKLAPAIQKAYDIPTMTQGALGPPARKLGPQDLSRLSEAFDRYTVATYAQQFDGFDGERFEVGDPKPSINGTVVVPSKIIPRNGPATEIDYVMHQDGAGWKIIDVLLDGSVSQVAVRRSEFGSIYRRDGLDGLIGVLDQKTAAMGK
jgi:phospholipid transport system substrate-binding protein